MSESFSLVMEDINSNFIMFITFLFFSRKDVVMEPDNVDVNDYFKV